VTEKINCKYIEEEKLVCVEFLIPDGTTRILALPPTEWGKALAKKIVDLIYKDNQNSAE
jgi:hypothetical protein